MVLWNPRPTDHSSRTRSVAAMLHQADRAGRLNSGVMPLKRTLLVNVGWALLLTIVFALLFVRNPSFLHAIVLGLGALFVLVALLAVRGRPWAVVISMLVAVALLVGWLPMVVLNFWMFLTNHPLYLDSPGTILIVAVYAALFVLPSLILVALYAVQWRSVRLALHHRIGA